MAAERMTITVRTVVDWDRFWVLKAQAIARMRRVKRKKRKAERERWVRRLMTCVRAEVIP